MRVSTRAGFAALAFVAACSSDSTSPTPQCTVSAVTVTGAPTELEVAATVQLTANITAQHCTTTPTVAWSSSNNGRATVSGSGLVTGVAAGAVTITATAGGQQGTATFDVIVAPVAAVRVIPDSIVIGVGAAATLAAEALGASQQVLPGRPITWLSLHPANATVSASGALTGVTEGSSATVTATAEGQVGTAVVHVVRRRLAYFWNNVATPAAIEVPHATYSYNSLGGALSIASSGTGRYSAGFTGMGGATHETEGMFTSAYVAPAGSFCRIEQWFPTSVNVNCHAANGDPADMRFTVAMVGSAAFTGRSGYAWIQNGTVSVTADPYYRFNPTGGAIISTRTGTGAYTVRFEGLGRAGGGDREGVIVNSYGGTAARTCQPASWTTVGSDLDIEVRCFDAAGVATNSAFTVLVVDGARAGARLGFAHADQPANTLPYTPANSAVRGSGSVLVERTGTGGYDVSFNEFYRSGTLAETFLVTATGETAGRCNLGSWGYSSTVGGTGTIGVQCFTTAGVPADLPFSIVALQ